MSKKRTQKQLSAPTLMARTPPSPTHLANAIQQEVATGEKTGRQHRSQAGLTGSTSMNLVGFYPAPAGTYKTYKEISSHPTVALVMKNVKSPVIINEWIWNKRSKEVPDLWLNLVQRILSPLRHQIVTDMLHALDMSWAPFEKVWNYEEVFLEGSPGEMTHGTDSQMYALVLKELKPLLWEDTEFWIDDATGKIKGLINKAPPVGEVKLALNKCLYHINDPMPGDPYGRSRHENIRQTWAEAEQLRQRVAQYMKKIAGIVVQLHYPEGSSLDSNGASYANQWLGQSILDGVATGHSVMFPNGFASIDPKIDPKGAYDLAGKSQWQLSTLNTGGTDYAPGMQQILEYYDQLLFQGWLRSARTGLESRHGSRADSQQHSSTGIDDCENIDRDICQTINKQLIDDILVLNFGERARGTVFVEGQPIADETIAEKSKILTTIIGSNFGQQAINQIDLRSLADDLDLKLVPADGSQVQSAATQGVPEVPAGKQAAVAALKDAGYSDDEISTKLAKRKKSAA